MSIGEQRHADGAPIRGEAPARGEGRLHGQARLHGEAPVGGEAPSPGEATAPAEASAPGEAPERGEALGAPAAADASPGDPHADLDDLRTALGDHLLDGPASLAVRAVYSSRAQPDGVPIAVVRASSTGDVSAALARAHARGIRVSVRGSGTELSGGAVA